MIFFGSLPALLAGRLPKKIIHFAIFKGLGEKLADPSYILSLRKIKYAKFK